MDGLSLPAGIRTTAQRRTLLALVEAWEGSFTVAELHERARRIEPGLGLATTYRTVELLRQAGSIHPLAGDGRHAYVLCGPTHHHHLVCTSCGGVEDTDLCAAPPDEELRRRHGFRPATHEVDIYGTCRRCAA